MDSNRHSYLLSLVIHKITSEMAGQASDRRPNRTTSGSTSRPAQARRLRRAVGRNIGNEAAPATTVDSTMPLILPMISSTLVHRAPTDLPKARNDRYFGNKVVLCFEEELTKIQALERVELFNQTSDIKLLVVASLPNALFAVQFDDEDFADAKASLLSSSPLRSIKVFASVNDILTFFTLARFPVSNISSRSISFRGAARS